MKWWWLMMGRRLRISTRLFLVLGALNFAGGLSGLDPAEAAAPEEAAFFNGGQNKQAPRGVATDLRPPDVIHWQVFEATAYQNGSVLVALRLTTEQDFTLYQDKVTFSSPAGYELVKIATPPTESMVDPISGEQVAVYRGGEFFLLFATFEPYIQAQFPVDVRYLGCTSRICLFPYTEHLQVNSYLSKEVTHSRVFPDELPEAPLVAAATTNPAATNPEATKLASANDHTTSKPAPQGQALSLEDRLARLLQGGGLSLAMLLLIVFLGGLLTNLTPCVYPMIPITVRLLANQGRSPLAGAASYAAGIMVTYTALGVFAAFTGSMFGQMMASPLFNSLFALVMLALGLSMLGFGDLAFLQNLGMRVGAGKASLKNAFLMGTGAGLVASPCTGPILAALLAYTATSQSGPLVASLLLFVYSLGFALPYVLLGGAAARVSVIKVGPQVQVAMKVVFATLMFALALYYARIPAYRLLKTFAAVWQPLTLGAFAVGSLAVVALFVKPSWQLRKFPLVVAAWALGLALFSGSQWLTRAGAREGTDKLQWYHHEGEAFAEAQRRGAPMIIDMWAEWCEACKKMDATTFADPQVVAKLTGENWVLLKFDLTEANDDNDKVQEKYKVRGLPTLVVYPPATGRQEPPLTIAGYVSAAALLDEMARLQAGSGE